jgi:hypothetical protein
MGSVTSGFGKLFGSGKKEEENKDAAKDKK